MFSDDEINERIKRTIAHCDVMTALAFADLTAHGEQETHAISEFGEAMERLLDFSIGELTTEQRTIYHQLVACDTPTLDALCEAVELAP